jgi:hypothetical protein
MGQTLAIHGFFHCVIVQQQTFICHKFPFSRAIVVAHACVLKVEEFDKPAFSQRK